MSEIRIGPPVPQGDGTRAEMTPAATLRTMLESIDPARLALVVGWTILMAILGTVLAGDAVRTWYPALQKGRIEIPIALFAVVGLVF